MLGKLKKGEKVKKEPVAKKEQIKQVPPTQQIVPKDEKQVNMEDEDEQIDLVSIDYVNREKKEKGKGAPKKKNKLGLEETQVVFDQKLIEKKKQEVKPRTTWVANSVEEATGKKFDIKEQNVKFESLTNQEINQKLKQEAEIKKKQQVQTPTYHTSGGGINFAPLEKTADQLAMERAEQKDTIILGNATNNTNSGLSSNITVTNNGKANSFAERGFTNTAMNNNPTNFAPLTKDDREQKMEARLREAEQKAADIQIKAKNQTWIGSKKTESIPQQPATKPKVNPWVIAATSNTSTNNMNFKPIQLSAQQQKLGGNERKQQEFTFVSKKQMQERRKKREQKQKLEKQSTGVKL